MLKISENLNAKKSVKNGNIEQYDFLVLSFRFLPKQSPRELKAAAIVIVIVFLFVHGYLRHLTFFDQL